LVAVVFGIAVLNCHDTGAPSTETAARRYADAAPAAAARNTATIATILFFEPQPNADVAAQFADVVAHPLDPARRRKLSESYAALGYRAVADFFGDTASALAGTAPRLELAATHPQWGCREVDPLPEIDRITAALNAGAYGDAKRIADEALRAHPHSCSVTIQHALATAAAAAATSASEKPQELELAFRTLLTADVEMNYQPYNVPPEWPYQLLAAAFALRGDIPSAYESALLAQRHFRKTPGEINAAAADEIDGMVENLRKKMPR
jgi:hypothetical protein